MATPSNLTDALRNLVGRPAKIRTENDTFTGTIAAVNENLVILCANDGVTYIKPAEIVAVSTV